MTTKRLTTTLAALTLLGVLAACSGSNDSDDVASVTDDDQSSEPAQDSEEELLDWVECMRGEGIDIADPTRDSDGNLVLGDDSGEEDDGQQGSAIDIGGGEGSATPEAMEAAEEACGAPPSLGAGNISEEDQQATQDAALDFAKCMREQGIEDFPDPDFSDMGPGGEAQPSPGDSEAGDGPDQQVTTGPFGDIDMDDPEIAAAFEACQDVLGEPVGGTGPAPSDESADT